MPHEHGIGDTERIQKGDREAGVGGVVVRDRWLVGKSEAAVVERNHAKASRGHGSDVLAPCVHRGAEAVEKDDRRAAPRVDVADPRAVDAHVSGGELGAGGEQLGLRQGGRSATAEGAKEQEQTSHARLPIQARARAATAGCELQMPAAASPLPATSTA